MALLRYDYIFVITFQTVFQLECKVGFILFSFITITTLRFQRP